MTTTPIAIRLLWALLVVAGLVLVGRGLIAGFSIENTSAALAEAAHGRVLVAGGAVLLLVAAAYAGLVAGWPGWVAVAVSVPAVVCGGLVVLAPETLFPLLAALVAFPVSAAGVLGGLVAGR